MRTTPGGRRIDYEAVVSGNPRLVPSGAAQDALAEDHASMPTTGMLLDEDEPFHTVMRHRAMIGERASAVLQAGRGQRRHGRPGSADQ